MAFLFCKEVTRLVRRSGPLHTALYLKQCASCLQTSYGGIKTPHSLLPVPVSLTRSGIPRIIPAHHRKVIRSGGPRGDLLVKCYLSFFTISKLITEAKRISSNTFKSITTTFRNVDRMVEYVAGMDSYFQRLTYRYLPSIRTVPVNQGIRWIPSWKALPSDRMVKEAIKKVPDLVKKYGNVRSPFLSFVWELVAYGTLAHMEHVQEPFLISPTLYPSGPLWSKRVRYVYDDTNPKTFMFDLTWFESFVYPTLPSVYKKGVPWAGGKLGMSLEGAGKRRIFAIGNLVKQRLLHPFHEWGMTLLKSIPNDGTYAQQRPLQWIKGFDECYSFDLTSATDRWPIYYLFVLMRHWFGDQVSGSVVNTTLAHNVFDLYLKKRTAVSFMAGQPLGYYFSWPLFTISHHMLVWYCAEWAYPGRLFRRYAILGDDIVIADSKVAALYEQALDSLGVDISRQKSLVSSTGSFEFAKKFFVKKGSKDLSPISFRALASFRSPFSLMGIHARYPAARFSTRVGGIGIRSIGALGPKESKTISRLRAMWLCPRGDSSFPLDLWLGRGKPLSPYVRGLCVSKLLNTLAPKQIQPIPEE